MTTLTGLKEFAEDRPFAFAAIIAGVVTGLRIALLPFYQTSLGPDEAQYWFWGQTLDWGYYSKPPMIAWVIALPTAIFGDHEWSVRLLSPLFIGGTALFLFAAARRLYGDRVAFWTLILWLTLPAVMLGATIMSTDIPLLFCWSAALYCLVRLSDGNDDATPYAVGLGAAIGLGMLSKYAMIYFVLGWGLSLFLSADARRTLRTRYIVPALAVGGLIFLPNLLWNMANGFQTVSHTADNAGWEGHLLNPDELLQFVGDQFGVAGPLMFGALLFGLVTLRARLRQAGGAAGKDMLLLSLVLPPLLIICVQALLSRAHANWAMTAYPAAIILIPAWLLRMKVRWPLLASVVLHGAVGMILTLALLNFSLADRLEMSNAIKRLRAWEVTAAQIRAAAAGKDGVVVDEREIAAHLIWEWRNDPVPLMVFDMNGRADNTYEHVFPFKAAPGGEYVIATQRARYLCLYDGFRTIQSRAPSFVDLHAERRSVRERTIELFAASDYLPLTESTCVE